MERMVENTRVGRVGEGGGVSIGRGAKQRGCKGRVGNGRV